MKTVVEWSEWVRMVGQEIEALEDMGKPARFDVEGRPLSPDLFLDVLAELESRGVQKGSLVAVVSPRQVAGLLDRVDALDRAPASEENPTLPEDVTLYGIPVRVELRFPDDYLVMFPPEAVTFEGTATYPRGVGIVQDLGLPDLDDADISVEDVRRTMFPELYPGVQDEETAGDETDDEDPDPDRKGERFVTDGGRNDVSELGSCPVCGENEWVGFSPEQKNYAYCGPCGTVLGSVSKLYADGGYEPPGGEPWVVTVGVDRDGDLVLQAITENVDLDGVDALEHRFYPVECDEGRVAVYSGVMVHSCKGDADEDSSCELYAPASLFESDPGDLEPVGTATVHDLPAEVRDRIGKGLPFDLPLRDPSEVENPADEPLGPEAFDLPAHGTDPSDREPRGFM